VVSAQRGTNSREAGQWPTSRLGGWNGHPSLNIERCDARIQARIRTCRRLRTTPKDTYETRENFACLYLLDLNEFIVAERVRFGSREIARISNLRRFRNTQSGRNTH